MTAHGTEHSNASEAPKVELAAAKGVVADTQPGDMPKVEREGVGGPFVIVNGDSDGLSDLGSDMSTGPEVNSPSDEEDLPRSNAGPLEESGGDHGTAGVGLGGLDVVMGVSSLNGHGCATVESKDGVGEGEGERSDDLKAEPGKLGFASGELGGADNLAKLGVDHADFAAPAVNSEVNCKSERENGVAHATELHEVASEEEHAEVNACAEPSELESEVCGGESKEEHVAAETTEEEILANGHGYTEDNADASGQLEPMVDEGEGEATCGVIALVDIMENNSEENLHDGRTAVATLEDITENDSEENLHDGRTVVVASSDEEAKRPMQEGIDEVTPALAGTGLVTRNNCEQIAQDDVVCTGKPESTFVELNGDQKVEVEIAGDDNTTGSDVKSTMEMDTSVSVQTEDLMSTVEDRNIPLHVNSSNEVEEKEVDSQAPVASTSPSEPRSIDLVDNDTVKQTNLVPESESYDHVQAEECSSQEISRTIVDQVTPAVSMESGVKAPFADKETCKDICSENINACNTSSHEAETKCSEVLQPSSVETVILEGHKDDDQQAHKDDEKIVEDSSESHVDLGMNNKADMQVIRPQKIFIVKVPRLASEEDWQRIQDVQAHLDRLTQERDLLNIRKKKQKAIFDEYRVKYEAASKEENEAKAAHGDKRNDLDSVRSMIGKLNKANSIEEIDDMIARKEMTMQHETISLKEEKLFIKEINELKAQRKQLCSNIGSKAEISEVFHQKDHIHEQHKTLKKDSDVLFQNLKSLGENTRKIKKSLDDERAVLRKINDELQTANEVRQKAYANWVELKREPARKNKNFFMYKSDRTTAHKHLQMGDMDGLQSYCNNQIEKVLNIWNKDDEFRKLYVVANTGSALKRLGTHDGRKLGLQEDPPVIPSYNFNRIRSNPSPLTVSSLPIITSEAAPQKPIPVHVPVEEDSFPVLPLPQIAKQANSKASGSSVQKEITAPPASEKEDVEDIEKEKARLIEELEVKRKTEELARREEELRQERAAAEKERLRLEQKAKAKEAEERKKKKAEKAQERAEFKMRKEAEMKEKKKAKKNKMSTLADVSNGGGEGNSAVIATAETDSNASENARDTELSQQAAPRKTARPAVAKRQLNRLQPMPLPLRNKGRRRMRQYILIGVAIAVSLVALLLAVKYIQFPSVRPPSL